MEILINFKNFLINYFKVLINTVFSVFYSEKCASCDCEITDGFLCKNCSKLVENLEPFAHSIVNGYNVYSCVFYQDGIKELIRRIKFRHYKRLTKYAAFILYEQLEKIKEYEKGRIEFKNPVIIPVPTHIKNFCERGFDNVSNIAEDLSNFTGFDINTKVLKKVKFTASQYGLGAKKRRNNVTDAFELKENFKCDSLIILLDDIFTTGSTLEFITSLFKKQGIENLICLTIAKTPYGKKEF